MLTSIKRRLSKIMNIGIVYQGFNKLTRNNLVVAVQSMRLPPDHPMPVRMQCPLIPAT